MRMEEKKEKWYFQLKFLIIAVFCVGPLAIPLLWRNPRYSIRTKIITSVIILLLTYVLTVVFAKELKIFLEAYQQLQSR
jgi:lipopolysaccharide export LptBFGC system permease protein LptF